MKKDRHYNEYRSKTKITKLTRMLTKTLRKGNHRYSKRHKNHKKVNNDKKDENENGRKTEKGRNEYKFLQLITFYT
jgi:hypothetical protein